MQLPLPFNPKSSLIHAEHIAARLGAEAWQDAQAAEGVEFPYFPLDRKCNDCMYTCRLRWRFAGLITRQGRIIEVGPFCPVLWAFSPCNPLAKVCHISAGKMVGRAG